MDCTSVGMFAGASSFVTSSTESGAGSAGGSSITSSATGSSVSAVQEGTGGNLVHTIYGVEPGDDLSFTTPSAPAGSLPESFTVFPPAVTPAALAAADRYVTAADASPQGFWNGSVSIAAATPTVARPTS